jgi:methenyltetrahydromethanopterin cyclohydrolase
VKSYGGNQLDIFPKKDRKSLAKDYVEEFEEIFKNQEFDFMK